MILSLASPGGLLPTACCRFCCCAVAVLQRQRSSLQPQQQRPSQQLSQRSSCRRRCVQPCPCIEWQHCARLLLQQSHQPGACCTEAQAGGTVLLSLLRRPCAVSLQLRLSCLVACLLAQCAQRSRLTCWLLPSTTDVSQHICKVHRGFSQAYVTVPLLTLLSTAASHSTTRCCNRTTHFAVAGVDEDGATVDDWLDTIFSELTSVCQCYHQHQQQLLLLLLPVSICLLNKIEFVKLDA